MLLVPMLAAVTLNLADTTSLDARSLRIGSGAALDAHTSPAAALLLNEGHFELSGYYAPDFALYDLTRGAEFGLMHRAGISYAWWTRRVRLTAGVAAAIGRESYLTTVQAPSSTSATPDTAPTPVGQMPPAPTAPTFVPETDVITTGYLSTTLEARVLLSRRWTLTSGIGYEIAGGLGDSDQFIPLHRGPNAHLSADYALTQRDDLTSSVRASMAYLPARKARFIDVSFLETWSHRFAPLTTTSLGAGATYLQSRPGPNAETDRSLLGAGLASLTQGFQLDPDTLFTLTTAASLGTRYNPVLGQITQQASGGVSAAWSKHRTTLGAGIFASQTLPIHDPAAARAFGANGRATYRVATPVLLEAGGGWTHQVLPDAVTVTGVSPDLWQAFVGVILTAPPLVL